VAEAAIVIDAGMPRAGSMVGCCRSCGKRVQARHELQTSDAIGAAASQLGSGAHAALTILNKEMGLSLGKCEKVFEQLLGVEIARSTGVRSMRRTANQARIAHQQARRAVRHSQRVVADETGWRVGGRNAWLHAFVGQGATCYEVGDRSGAIAEKLLGLDWRGTLIHDGWSVYDRFTKARHQQCLRHLQRRCEQVIDQVGERAAALPNWILAWIDQAFALRRLYRGRRISRDDLSMGGLALACELEERVEQPPREPALRRLARHVQEHCLDWAWFLFDPAVDATNYRAEQALRPAVVNRKVWGGNRTGIGAETQAVLMTVIQTVKQRGRDALDWLARLRRSLRPIPLPRLNC